MAGLQVGGGGMVWGDFCWGFVSGGWYGGLGIGGLVWGPGMGGLVSGVWDG